MIKLILFFLIMTTSHETSNPCSDPVYFQWEDKLKTNGAEYIDTTNTILHDEVIRGNKIGKIENQLDPATCSSYIFKNGDASYLPTNTEIYEMVGYQPTFRLIAKLENQLKVYEAAEKPTRMSKLYDLENNVEEIMIDGVSLSNLKKHFIEEYSESTLEEFVEEAMSHFTKEITIQIKLLNGNDIEETYRINPFSYESPGILSSKIKASERMHSIILMTINQGKGLSSIYTIPTVEAPNVIDLSFTPLKYSEAVKVEPEENWKKVNSFPFGDLEGKAILLHVYKEITQENKSYFYYYIEYENQMFFLKYCHCIYTDKPDIKILQNRDHSVHNSLNLIGTYGDSVRFEYVVYDELNEKWLLFDNWGAPKFIDLDHDGKKEIISEYRWDVSIIRWNEGQLEAVGLHENTIQYKNLPEMLGITKHVFFRNENNSFFEFSIWNPYDSDLSFYYQYETDHLKIMENEPAFP
ncbi:hypothetical protein [Chengkuizengella axinellae]|uniref:VCBS repeat-containing protein n=1 Tax=Chengkuizengella axinellae TaxID=3064388 RepID=A0ABT9IWB5_9BACL|nr:hypothetical protein [Chengkuizengella sp. 2205SS18-9]MDP5273654.1 hypothetical protein [Chengkuizengella sp. 2205SS18-9]